MKKEKTNEKARDKILLNSFSELTALIDLLIEKKLLNVDELVHAIDNRKDIINKAAVKLGLQERISAEKPVYFG